MSKFKDRTTMYTFNKKYLMYGFFFTVAALMVVFVVDKNGSNGGETLTMKKSYFLQQVSISGKVVAAKSVNLAFSQTGRVSRVYVDVGDVAVTGSVLASIENGDVRADVLQKEAALLAAEVALRELKQGSRQEEIVVSEAKVYSAETDLKDAQRSLEEKTADLYIKSDDAVRTQADQFFSNPHSSNPQLLFDTDGQLEQAITALRIKLEEVFAAWNPTGTVSGIHSEIADISLKNSSLVRDFLEKTALALSTLDASSTLTQTTIDGWKSDISGARTTLSTATNNLVTAIGRVSSAKAALTLAQKELLLKEAEATKEDIEEQEANIKAAEANLVSAQAKYQKTLVVAPFTGIVSKMDAKVGSSAASNTSLISMISTDTLQIESFVPEINTPLIEVGDSAVVTLDAYGAHVPFGTTVISIDPVETIRDGVSTYRAKLQFDESDNRIKSGMTANIIVTTEEKKDVLSVPQGIVFSGNDGRFIYVQEGGVFTKRIVTTGSVSSLGEVEILSGLNEGDIVSFGPPK